MSAITAGEKPFDIRAIDELGATIAATQLYNFSTPELVHDVIALFVGICQFREQLASAIATHHRMDTTHFSKFFRTLESVQATITRTSRSIAAYVDQT